MLKSLRTVIPLALLAAATAPALAQPGGISGGAEARAANCRQQGGTYVNNSCQYPQRQQQPQQNAPQASGRGRGGRGEGPPSPQAQQGGRAGRDQNRQDNVEQQATPKGPAPGELQRRGGGGGLRGGPPPEGQFGQNDRGRNFDNDRGRDRATDQRDRDRERAFDDRERERAAQERERERAFDARERERERERAFNYDRREFDRRYYGRYGDDPASFLRARERFRREARWRERYYHDYVYADDSFYRDCRSDNEIGGAIIGSILGGLIGSAASGGQGGPTVAGLILGGIGGAAIANNLSCQDRGYLYPVYYDAFEHGRPGARYGWRNAGSGAYGDVIVRDFYRDRDGYRCVHYSQTIFVRGRRFIDDGDACRQDDGTWAVVG